jgi:hypothetical protein
VILTAYFDESGTHAGSELAIMAGFVGDARQWRKFEKRTTKLFAKFGVDIFHSVDVKRSGKDFAGWTVDRKITFLDEFQHIVNETLERGVASILRYDDYDYYKSLEWPKGARMDSLYGILFRSTMSAVIGGVFNIDRWAFGVEPKLRVVLESGHKNAGDAVRLYNMFSDRFAGGHKALSGLTFQDKVSNLPLAAADLFAYSAYGEETNAKQIGYAKDALKSEQSYRGNAYRIVVGRQTLEALRDQAIDLANERASASRRGKR